MVGWEATVYDRQLVADHAQNLATKIRNNLTNSMKSLGVDILTGFGTAVGLQKVKYGKVGGSETLITTKDIIIATGSVPFVPKGVEVDGDFCRSIRSVDAWFDPENGKLAQRVLINPRKIDYHTGVFACKVLTLLTLFMLGLPLSILGPSMLGKLLHPTNLLWNTLFKDEYATDLVLLQQRSLSSSMGIDVRCMHIRLHLMTHYIIVMLAAKLIQ
ncbi:hypothetical protein Ccrd_020087 [Cynara cardunculus var. scolymus]|uniref:FAD/NAD(P)-binding domain-containing protein n=1 Tax=Cynara cardunculus var. scolymus TaxID=59895 RepID=A0A124SEZ4_CYNCS|nr:hypothetical protein Ccrd_020087 [Cynara cardunculus var. scolymus]